MNRIGAGAGANHDPYQESRAPARLDDRIIPLRPDRGESMLTAVVRSWPFALGCLSLVALGGCGLGCGCGGVATTPVDSASLEDVAALIDARAPAPDGGGAPSDVAPDGPDLVARRPYRMKVPGGYDGTAAVPLLVLFHGYGGTGMSQDSYFRLSALADARTFLLATPDGTVDSSGRRFWSATDACCNFAGAPVDDVAYFNAIVDDAQSRYKVDGKRIFVVGFSNGGFMAHRLACDAAPRIAGIVSLAGAAWQDGTRCAPSEAVAVLQVHGQADATVLYAGGRFSASTPPYPGAVETVTGWAERNRCGSALTPTGATLDLDTALAGAETDVARFEGCAAGAAVELWTIRNGAHVPVLGAHWAPAIYDFLSAHPKR